MTAQPPQDAADTADAEGVEIAWHEIAYRGFFRIDRYRLRYRKHDGGWTDWMTREIFERGHTVGVLPYDPTRDLVVLLSQFRVGARAGGKAGWQTEIVAGVIEDGETPEEVARRETREEAGLDAGELVPVCHYLVSPGGTSETMRVYYAPVDAGAAGGIHGLDHEAEDIRVDAVPFEQAWAMLQRGTIDNGPAIIALQWLALNRARLRAGDPGGGAGA